MGPLPKSTSGNRFILVIVDYFTKWAEAVPIPTQDAETISKALFNSWISQFGPPTFLHSDCGANFTSQTIRQLCNLLGIEKTRTTPYHPEGNGQVERTNRTIINLLRAYTEPNCSVNWDEQISRCLLSYRATVHSSTGFSPFHLTFGREMRLPSDLSRPINIPANETPAQFVLKLQEDLRKSQNLARVHMTDAYRRQKEQYDLNAQSTTFEPGDLVRLYRPVPPVGVPRKLHHAWEEVFRVVQVKSPSTFVLQDVRFPMAQPVTAHFNRLKLYAKASTPITPYELATTPSHLVPPYSEEVVIPASGSISLIKSTSTEDSAAPEGGAV
jgi:hypothetical protein